MPFGGLPVSLKLKFDIIKTILMISWSFHNCSGKGCVQQFKMGYEKQDYLLQDINNIICLLLFKQQCFTFDAKRSCTHHKTIKKYFPLSHWISKAVQYWQCKVLHVNTAFSNFKLDSLVRHQLILLILNPSLCQVKGLTYCNNVTWLLGINLTDTLPNLFVSLNK